MKSVYFSLTALCLAALVGCGETVPIADETGGRELKPPREGIRVGSLYYVRENPTNDLTRPANLESLCFFDLPLSDVTLEADQRVADIDLLKKLEASGELGGIETKFASAGLSGGIDRYYSYKLTNARKSSVTLQDASRLFNEQGDGPKCSGWRENVGQFDWAAYQIQSVISGDIIFARKSTSNASGDLSAALEVLEPELVAELSKENSAGVTGTGLVVSFVPISRQ